MSLKTKTLLGALVLAVVAYGYYTHNNTADTASQDDQSSIGTVIETPVSITTPNVETPIAPAIAVPTVEVKPTLETSNVEKTEAIEKTGTVPSIPKVLVK